ncbi:hypothetical protein A3C17_02635 [Candidatus Uhrbacteria bacterium RIFCSPHIGHO2_02_FULL_53_13]|uniref:Lipid/polyisoprenoid-binding YceI-like domain-containing protein n=2 Tax=Candidatus Uhriibacteriota TaxID=1752732 RepID=A0A1F7TZX2_9BACT|nr:MAG: hypothetical protein A3C17_02635 [Candidatus Uhrbacteria bacterium RIFCSPHIGHO2_02_FULL_53_13]OGL89608.1 MAG: hypothetical protein A3I45_00180 [Candidatus Uhrbacteria bacterium RIFCSPLOWO2_02_FULL_53_10]
MLSMQKLIGFIAALVIIAIGIWIVLAIMSMSQGPIPEPVSIEKPSDTASAPPNIEHLNYTLDAENSTLTWNARRMVGAFHSGGVGIESGHITFEESIDGRVFSGGAFTVDMQTITESKDNQLFLKHVRSNDFFDVKTYPTSALTLTDVQWSGQGNTFAVSGDLTIKDRTVPIVFPAEMTFRNDRAIATALIEIDRTDWGIEFQSESIFLELGDGAIKDAIQFNLALTFIGSD